MVYTVILQLDLELDLDLQLDLVVDVCFELDLELDHGDSPKKLYQPVGIYYCGALQESVRMCVPNVCGSMLVLLLYCSIPPLFPVSYI